MVSEIAGAVGGLASAGLNAYTAYKNRQSNEKLTKEKANRLSKAVDEGKSEYDNIISLIDEYRNNQTQLASPDIYKKYLEAITSEKNVYDFDEFNFDKDVNDYVSPYLDEIVARAGRNVMHQYGKSGMGDSGFEQMAAFRSEAEKMDDLLKSAKDEYRADRDFAYKEYSDYITNMQNKYKDMATNKTNQINLLSGAISHDENQESDYMADLLAAMTSRANLGVQGALYT